MIATFNIIAIRGLLLSLLLSPYMAAPHVVLFAVIILLLLLLTMLDDDE